MNHIDKIAAPMNAAAATPGLARRPLLAAAALVLAGCGTSPPVQLHRLVLDSPTGADVAKSATAAAATEVWELARLVIPEYLDRDAVLVASGASGLRALSDQRWAEPLREAVPRLLQHDLRTLRGGDKVWPAPAPQGVRIDRNLRLEIQSLQADPQRGRVRLQANWVLIDPRGQVAPRLGSADIEAAFDGIDMERIVAAHRLALWRLAQRVALG